MNKRIVFTRKNFVWSAMVTATPEWTSNMLKALDWSEREREKNGSDRSANTTHYGETQSDRLVESRFSRGGRISPQGKWYTLCVVLAQLSAPQCRIRIEMPRLGRQGCQLINTSSSEWIYVKKSKKKKKNHVNVLQTCNFTQILKAFFCSSDFNK